MKDKERERESIPYHSKSSKRLQKSTVCTSGPSDGAGEMERDNLESVKRKSFPMKAPRSLYIWGCFCFLAGIFIKHQHDDQYINVPLCQL